jgi:hypothetical protein
MSEKKAVTLGKKMQELVKSIKNMNNENQIL